MGQVVVTGVTGQLGHDVAAELMRRGTSVIGATRREMPLTEAASCAAFVETVRPEMVIHCGAYTAVDQAEEEPELCHKINAEATGAIAVACHRVGAKLIYISTDYVFPGDGDIPYEIDAATGPRNVYGASKFAGEEAVKAALAAYFIVRTSWVFGGHGKNFIRTMLRLAKSQEQLRVVADQIGSPTYTVDLARLLADMAESQKFGVYHATNEGFCSWYDLAAEVFRQRGLSVAAAPVLSAAYSTKARRPHNSRLSKRSLDVAGFDRLPPWPDAVRRYLAELAAMGA